jgi:hypothetical protein
MDRLIAGLRISFREDRATLPVRAEFVRIHQLTPNYQALSAEFKAIYLTDLRAAYYELNHLPTTEPEPDDPA